MLERRLPAIADNTPGSCRVICTVLLQATSSYNVYFGAPISQSLSQIKTPPSESFCLKYGVSERNGANFSAFLAYMHRGVQRLSITIHLSGEYTGQFIQSAWHVTTDHLFVIHSALQERLCIGMSVRSNSRREGTTLNGLLPPSI